MISRSLAAALGLAVLLIAALPAQATPLLFKTLVSNEPAANPLMIFGFNPQPEPPPADAPIEEVAFTYAKIDWTFDRVDPGQTFVLYFGGPGLVPPRLDPAVEYETMRFEMLAGIELLYFDLTFDTSSGGVGTGFDAVAFNPQPEPPADWDFFAWEFAFTSYSSVGVSMAVSAASGAEVGFGPAPAVPLPAGLPLLAAGLAGAGVLRRRYRIRF
ncbi:hypothetical protein GCM10011360_15510 [Primorskyibacter flagellatus]|uniref:VPLPA-CTERM protein sorting domain-containing protein n=1 Tax=Primorskyibacter flagellatus TaxID=1387277 RepID=A0A917A5W2_9RHOB|nr:VPLPA-CTERM sorting domain-containing protein [Primorskyibacter flagellatus]GGE28219.1 hypothetical protein GCM10011360_15510 [Primorskyibacter flagellatus]